MIRRKVRRKTAKVRRKWHKFVEKFVEKRQRFVDNMNVFGQKIKQLREEHGLFQRHLCVALEIDTPMYSKIERGERKAKRSQIPIMAKVFGVDEKELLTVWLADKVLDILENEDDVKNDAIRYVQKVIKSGK